jgi:hypothetical protein
MRRHRLPIDLQSQQIRQPGLQQLGDRKKRRLADAVLRNLKKEKANKFFKVFLKKPLKIHCTSNKKSILTIIASDDSLHNAAIT